MGKVALILLLLAWQGPPPNQAAPHSVQQKTDSDKGNTEHGFPIAGRATADNKAEYGGTQTKENDEQSIRIVPASKIQTDSKKDSWDKALVGATWGLVIIGACQIIFLWRTVIATRDNAKATRLNAQAVIDSERPWLLMRGEIGEPDFESPMPGKEEFRGCTFRMNNYGRTPAKVVAEHWGLQIGDSFDRPPKEEFFTNLKDTRTPYIFPSKTKKKRFAILGVDRSLETEDTESILKTKTKSLWLCVAIRYQNTLGEQGAQTYVTHYCYLYETRLTPEVTDKPFWRTAGPSEYNKAT